MEEAEETQVTTEITIEQRLDMIGEQLNWLCDNLAGLFQFVSQMGANGGGIRGLMKTMKESPELIQQVEEAGIQQ